MSAPAATQARAWRNDAALDGGDVGEALAADGRGASQLAGARHGRHVLGRAQRLAGIGLDADDELALEGFDQGMHGHGIPPSYQTVQFGTTWILRK